MNKHIRAAFFDIDGTLLFGNHEMTDSTVQALHALQANGVKTLVLVTEKNTTTLNLSLLCEGQKSSTRVTLRHLGSNATLSVGLRCRRDLLIGR